MRRDQWWRRGWVPFVSRDGDHLVLDLDPAPDGRSGQVFAFSHETGPGRIVAPDFGAWLAIWLDDLEAGIAARPAADDPPENSSRAWPDT